MDFNCDHSGNFGVAGDANNTVQRIITSAVEDITQRLDQMNVDMFDVQNMPDSSPMNAGQCNTVNLAPMMGGQMSQVAGGYEATRNYHQQQQSDETILMQDEDDIAVDGVVDNNQRAQQDYSSSNILIVTNVDSSVFNDKSVQSNFESLFLAYDPSVTFRYLKSFRRVRLDFTTVQGAEMARSNLSQYKLGNTEFRCYSAQIIRPNNNNNFAQMNSNSQHLNIPKLTKQFLISPPASPPVGWEPVTENSPCIDVQLISAIANLVPGKVHEIHPGNESQPGIYVEVCEDARYESSMKSCSRIPRTMSPGYCQ